MNNTNRPMFGGLLGGPMGIPTRVVIETKIGESQRPAKKKFFPKNFFARLTKTKH